MLMYYAFTPDFVFKLVPPNSSESTWQTSYVIFRYCSPDCEESGVPKNWCFWTVVLEKTLESPLDCKEIHQSILKEISPGCSLEGMMLKLKLQYFGHLMQRVDSLEKTLMLGGIRGRRRRGWQRMRCLDGIIDSMDMSLSELRELVMACCNSWGCKESDMTEQLNWTELSSLLMKERNVLKVRMAPGPSSIRCILGYPGP